MLGTFWNRYAEPNLLFENNGSGHFSNVSHRAGDFASRIEVSRGLAFGDLDDDGDVDVLSASHDDNTIAWYENTDGAGSFGVPRVISAAALGVASVFATDLDGDGDADVLSASRDDDKIAQCAKDGAKTAIEAVHGLFAQTLKAQVFNRAAAEPGPAR